MTKQTRFDLPTKPHIRKFVHVQCGYPFQINGNTQLGSILLTLLEKKSHLNCGLNTTDRKKRMKHLTAKVECFAKLHRLKQAGIDIPDHQIIRINQLLEHEFEKELHAYVKYNTGPTGRYPGYMDALRGFMQEYCISEDIDMPLDTLKKIEYRHRKELQSNRAKLMQSGSMMH